MNPPTTPSPVTPFPPSYCSRSRPPDFTVGVDRVSRSGHKVVVSGVVQPGQEPELDQSLLVDEVVDHPVRPVPDDQV